MCVVLSCVYFVYLLCNQSSRTVPDERVSTCMYYVFIVLDVWNLQSVALLAIATSTFKFYLCQSHVLEMLGKPILQWDQLIIAVVRVRAELLVQVDRSLESLKLKCSHKCC